MRMHDVCFTIGDMVFENWAVIWLGLVGVCMLCICCLIFLSAETIGEYIDTKYRYMMRQFYKSISFKYKRNVKHG